MAKEPFVHTCEDLAGEFGVCCSSCHEHGDRITVYPESVFSVGFKDKMPDLSMGLRAEICCRLYDEIKRLKREWWVELYGRKHGYRLEHIEKLIEVCNDPKRWLQVCGEIGSLYWRESNPDSGIRRDVRVVSRTSGLPTRKSTISKCPSCGSKWSGEVCENCGHGIGV